MTSSALLRPRRAALALVAAGLLSALGYGPATADDAVLARFKGEWVGKGRVLMAPGGETRRAFCRIRGSLAEGGRVLEQSGRCAAGEDTRRITARVVNQGGDLYVGNWDAGMGSAQVSGTARDNGLDLVLESGGGIPEGASPTITLTFNGSDAYVMEMTGVDPRQGRFKVGEIVFRRQ